MGLVTFFEPTQAAPLRPFRIDPERSDRAERAPSAPLTRVRESAAAEEEYLLVHMRFEEHRARRSLELLWESEEFLPLC